MDGIVIWILFIASTLLVYWYGYRSGYDQGYSDAVDEELKNMALRNMEAVRRKMRKEEGDDN